MTRRATVTAVVTAVALGAALVTGCGDPAEDPAQDGTDPTGSPSAAPTGGTAGGTGGPSPTLEVPERPETTRGPTLTARPRSPEPPLPPGPSPSSRRTAADPRWRFFTDDRTPRSSPWFPGRHRVMIGFGCTPAPYYSPDPTCPGGQGFHHGVDVALPCGTPLTVPRRARVLPTASLGPAYGETPVLLRLTTATGAERDVVVGHTRDAPRPGALLRAGERFAVASDRGAPDGCHLHLEVRTPGGGVDDAVDPAPLLALRPPFPR